MKVRARVTIAWWLPWYMTGVVFMCKLTGAEPDWAKLGRVVRRATRIHVS